jgi:hypothetical protein
LLLTVAFIALAGPAGAGGLTLEERVERLERRGELPPTAAAPAADTSGLQERIDALEAHLKNFPFGLKVGGMVVASYLYDFNDPDSDTVSLRSFDRDHNSFVLDLFQLQVSRAPGENGVGFLTKVNFGKTAERMASDWDGDGTVGNVAEEQNSVEVQDALITYNFPGLPELGFKAGKFVTLVGAEVIESPLNYNISRSLAFSWAIPFTHTGVLTTYAFAPEFGLTLGAVNGWDNVVDSNDGKSVLGQMAITPVEQFSLLIGGLYGAEQPDRGDSKRGLVDVVATIKPIDTLAFSLNYDYGNESDLDAATSGTVEWQAVSGIIAFDVPDTFAVPIGFAVRGEYFDDSDGTRLPTPGGTGFGDYQNAWEVTGTFKLVLAEGLMFRTEYRYDSAKNDLYEKETRSSGSFQDDQHTVAAELSYVF